MMDKAKVLDFYKIEDQGYQSTCTVIGLKNPKTLTGEQLDHFDTVRLWLDNKEVRNFKEARERFRLELEKEPEALLEIKEMLNSFMEERANNFMEELLSKLESDEAELLQVALDAISKHLSNLKEG
jgi:tRNA isopentenyl-2-thiomethyl-A-37 hydroxylase MiaE